MVGHSELKNSLGFLKDSYSWFSNARFPLQFMDTTMGQMYHRRDMYQMPDGNYIFFGHGKKDNWAAAVASSKYNGQDNTRACALAKDTHYLELITLLVSCGIPANEMWSLIFWVYDHSALEIPAGFCDAICAEARKTLHKVGFGGYELVYQVTCRMLLHLYYGFIAENYFVSARGSRTRLGPMIKLNAVYEVLFGHHDIENAANAVRNTPAVDIYSQCKSRCISLPSALQAMGIDYWQGIGWEKVDVVEAKVDAIVDTPLTLWPPRPLLPALRFGVA